MHKALIRLATQPIITTTDFDRAARSRLIWGMKQTETRTYFALTPLSLVNSVVAPPGRCVGVIEGRFVWLEVQ